MTKVRQELLLEVWRRLPALLRRALILSALAPALSCTLCFAQSSKPEISPLEAVQQLHLPHQAGAVPLYYSPCCRERAADVQYRLQDMLAFYKEKLGINASISVAVLDEKDWNRVARQLQDMQRFPPYGMTNVEADHSGAEVIAFIPADDSGVITKSQLADAPFATADVLKTFASVDATYGEAARRFIMHPAFHEVGHLLTRRYGIDVPDHWVDEMMASYFAYAYERARDPAIATLVEGFAKMRSPPVALTSLGQFEEAFARGKEILPANYVWYQRHFEARVVDVYRDERLDFIKSMKSAFPVPPRGARPHGIPNVSETLSRMERIDPGFEGWSKKLANYKPEAAPQVTARR